MDFVGGKMNVPYSVCAEIYGDPNVDMSIDCFVQFNPNNGKDFQKTLRQIYTLYSGTFAYFWDKENGVSAVERIQQTMARGVNALHLYLKN